MRDKQPALRDRLPAGSAGRRGVVLTMLVLICGLVGLFGLGAPIEDGLRLGRDLVLRRPAPPSIAVVGIDDESLAEFGRWPWPRRVHARIIDELHRLHAHAIFFDVGFYTPTTTEDDDRLAAALAGKGGRTTLAGGYSIDDLTGQRSDTLPIERFARLSDTASIDWNYDRQGRVERLPTSVRVGSRMLPSMSSALAGTAEPRDVTYPVDLSMDPRTIPVIGAARLLARQVPESAIAGRNVIVGAVSHQLKDDWMEPGYGMVPGVFVHILGAHTLRAGRPTEVPWSVPYGVAALLALLPLAPTRRRYVIAGLGFAAVVTLFLPLLLKLRGVETGVAPALVLLVATLTHEGWGAYRNFYRRQAKTNPISGLPNLAGLLERTMPATALVVARVRNFTEIVATLPLTGQRPLVQQIAQRLSLSGAAGQVFQGDEGIFAWLHEGSLEELPDHLEALHVICRAPLAVADRRIDLQVTLGADIDTARPVANRLASALLAANESDHSGERWTFYQGPPGEEAAWKLSLLGQLDEAIETGQIWVAYQPQLDVATGRIESAEALVRWSHPEKGPIAPDAFISAAERGDRITGLTLFVLERAISDARLMNDQGTAFTVAVNLSPRLLRYDGLVAKVRELLDRHGLLAERLTLEITETAEIMDNKRAITILSEFRAMGVNISIDDYGTGRSTLEYLRNIPANEVKIDQSFVRAMTTNASDRIMVASTIELAHSLGHKVVAEGVEDAEMLEALVTLGCDLIQGYHIDRPMPFSALAVGLLKERSSTAA